MKRTVCLGVCIFLVAGIWLSCSPEVDGQNHDASWEYRTGRDKPIFQYLLKSVSGNQEKAWLSRKDALLKLVKEHPNTSYAVDARLVLAMGRDCYENDPDAAMKDLRSIIERHPWVSTIVTVTGDIDPVWLRYAPSTAEITPDGSVGIRPFPREADPVEHFDGSGYTEARRYFEHFEELPCYAADVANLMRGQVLAKQGRTNESVEEYEAVIQRHGGGRQVLEADRIAGDKKFGYLIATSWRPLAEVYWRLFHQCISDGKHDKAIEYGLKFADWRSSYDGKVERVVAEACVKARAYDAAERLYRTSLDRFMRLAHKDPFRNAERIRKTREQLSSAIDACRKAEETGRFAVMDRPQGPYASERGKCDQWPPISQEEREKLGISKINEERLGTDQSHLLNGQRLWLWATLDLLMKEGFRPDLKRTLSLENWPASRRQVVTLSWSAMAYSLQARREVKGDPGAFILIVPKDAERFAGLGEARRAVGILDSFLSDRFQIKPEDMEQPPDGHKALTYEFKDGIAFMKFDSRPEQDVSAEIWAWCTEDRIVLKVSDPALREAKADSAMKPGYPPAKLLSLVPSLANLPEADEGRALFENLARALKRNSKTAHEQLNLLLAHGGPWALTGAVGAVCAERSDNPEARAIGAKTVVDMMANLAIPASQAATEEEKLVIQRNIENLIVNQKEPQGEAYASAKVRIQEAEGRATPFLLDALKKDPPRPVKETICELIDRYAQLDQLAEVVKACAGEPDGDLRSRMIDDRFGAKIKALQENWEKYVKSAGDGKAGSK